MRTEGTPLSKGEIGPIGQAVVDLINTYTRGGLTTVTTMQLSGAADPWTFFQGVVAPNANGELEWLPDFITGGTPSYYIRTAPGGFPITGTQPPPKNPVNTHNLYGPNGPNLAAQLYALDNPGEFGNPAVGSGKDAPTGAKLSVLNTDCVSCHSTATRAQALKASAGTPASLANLYVPPPGITGYLSPEVVPRDQYDFRNFGYFVPQNARVHQPRVMTRTLNESAEAARFFNANILPAIYGKAFPNPGYTCGEPKSRKAQAKLHAEVWDCMISNFPAKTGMSPEQFKDCFKPCGNEGPLL